MFARSALFLCNLALVAAAKITPRATGDTFQLYAYGENIGGLNLFSSGSAVYLGDYSLFSNSSAAPIEITVGDSVWTASANATTATWSDKTFAVQTSSHTVAVASTVATNDISSFHLYGRYVTAVVNGSWEMLWFAVPTSIDGIWALRWDLPADDPSNVAVTIRNIEPSEA